jgi:hypothetical protein
MHLKTLRVALDEYVKNSNTRVRYSAGKEVAA